MAKHRDANTNVKGREEFVNENAMALLRERDAKIERQRGMICKLEESIRHCKRIKRDNLDVFTRVHELSVTDEIESVLLSEIEQLTRKYDE